jgi:hypothetical protein
MIKVWCRTDEFEGCAESWLEQWNKTYDYRQ